jgi:hypothetical protein
VRYTRWEPDPEGFVRTVGNQVEFVLGFSGGGVSDWHRFGQRFSFAVAAGKGLTLRNTYINPLNGTPVTNFDVPGPRSLIAGPMFELALPGGLTVEADAIRRPMHLRFRQTSMAGNMPAG